MKTNAYTFAKAASFCTDQAFTGLFAVAAAFYAYALSSLLQLNLAQ